MKNNSINQTDYFKTIKKVIDNLDNSGMIKTGSGYCLGMSDIALKLLHKHGIKSKIVECTLMVTLKNPPGLYLMGYPGFNSDNYNSEKMMQTHIVCVTETEIPVLIDLSISHIDKNIPYICAPILKSFDNTNLLECEFETSTWTYTQKQDTELEISKLHQKSILDRINTDRNIFDQIKFIKIIMLAILSLSTINIIRGFYDFHQKYINKTNGFGPHKVEHIKQK